MAQVRTLTKVLVLSDLHAPYHDAKAISIAKQFHDDFKPDITIALGDWLDVTNVSAFANDAATKDQLYEFDICNELLDQFPTTKYFLEGNHEERLRRSTLLPAALKRMVDPQIWLNLRQRGIKWVRYSASKKHVLRLGELAFVHGFYFNQYAAKAHAEKFGNVVFGHTHRIQQITLQHIDEVTGFNIGCLCELEGEGQKYAETRVTGWQQGFGFGYLRRSGNFTFNTVRIRDYKAFICGKDYKA